MKRRPSRPVLIVGIAVILLTCVARFALPLVRRASVLTSSALTRAIDIAELSTAEFRYRGIADVYADEARTKVQCKICYSAVVKAGIDMKDVRFTVDQGEKTVHAALPEIGITVSIVDETSMAVLPSDADVSIESMLKYSREDAEREAKASEELKKTARENLESTIEGLLFPLLNPQGYTLTFEDQGGAGNGGDLSDEG